MIIVDGSSGAARRVYPPCVVRYSSPQSTIPRAQFTASHRLIISQPHNKADFGAER